MQRDYGDRRNRKPRPAQIHHRRSRLEWFQAEFEKQLGWPLEPARPFRFEHRGDRYGWTEASGGKWHLTLQIENGRIRDRGRPSAAQRTAGDRRGARAAISGSRPTRT